MTVQEIQRVFVAMSGGVDSSLAAVLLLQRGYHVEGVTMRLWRESPLAGDASDAIADARGVCQFLGIPHHEIDLRELFYDQVIRYFITEYERGRTPNPCLPCNRLLKFGMVWRAARQAGADLLATGHYARVQHTQDGGGTARWHLLCAVDRQKDQSYVLYALNQIQLASLVFPLGDYSKSQVRQLARQYGLPVAERPESQDLCFLRDSDYRRFLGEHLGDAIRPGPIYDRQGRCLGQHRGLPFYTVGQREGLRIAAPRPLYVLALDGPRNALVVGHAEELGCTTLLADEMSYISGQALPPGYEVQAKIRYRAQRVDAWVWSLPQGRARVVFARPLRDITPGQAVVLYRDQEVLGGGIIAQALAGHGIENDTM